MVDVSARGLSIFLESVASLGDEGSVVRFVCEVPQELGGPVAIRATCGVRRKRPATSTITFDEVIGDVRRLTISARLPRLLASCTLRVRVGTGFGAHRARCVVDQTLFERARDAHVHAQDDSTYPGWFEGHRVHDSELVRQRDAAQAFPARPLLSIVCPVFRPSVGYLRKMVDSVVAQTYDHWELLLVNVSGDCPEVAAVLASYDDPRIRVVEAPNRSISENTNVGIAVATGDYVGFVDHDDWIEPDALFCYVETLASHPGCDLLFCDEDLWGVPEGESSPRFFGARFKPSWNPDLLFTHDYVCHLLMTSRRALEATERSTTKVAGAQDYDLTLRVSEVARDICHVPRVLYHWRVHEASTAINRDSKPYALEAGRLAVQGHFDRIGMDAKVGLGSHPFSYRVSYPEPGPVSLARWERTAEATGDVLNAVVRDVAGTLVVLTASDVAFRDGEEVGVREAAGPLLRPEVGCVGPSVLASDEVLQAHGLIARSDGSFGRAGWGRSLSVIGYMSMLCHARDVTALPASCLAFRKSDLDRLGGFAPDLSADAAAIDFCLRLHEGGMLVVVEPYGPVAQTSRLLSGFSPSDACALTRLHPWLAQGDPYLDPSLDPRSEFFELGRETR